MLCRFLWLPLRLLNHSVFVFLVQYLVVTNQGIRIVTYAFRDLSADISNSVDYVVGMSTVPGEEEVALVVRRQCQMQRITGGVGWHYVVIYIGPHDLTNASLNR